MRQHSDFNKMKHFKHHEHSPARSIGVFLIALGLMMAVALFDLLGLGEPGEYFKWQLFLIFIGLISLFTRNSVGGIILMAIGAYFLIPETNLVVPDVFERIYWPAAIVLVGITFLVSGLVKRSRNYSQDENFKQK